MNNRVRSPIFVGDTVQHLPAQDVQGGFVQMLGDVYYRIKNFDAMQPFFMTIVSGSNHWLFISSTGGLSAGRDSAEQALFPYYTEDKLTENYENTGSKSILFVSRGEGTSLWEPFSRHQQGSYHIERNLYKNVTGTAVVFEEINHSLGLAFRYAWRTGDKFGLIKTTWLANSGDRPCSVEFLDGIQNILPANVTSLTQNTFSPLLDAYKWCELDPQTGLAIYALNSTLTDLAEPSESLLGTTALQLGLFPDGYLLSSAQLDRFRAGWDLVEETEVRGRRGAYFVHAVVEVAPGEERVWHIAADVSQDSEAIVRLRNRLRSNPGELLSELEADIKHNDTSLKRIVASADGLQSSNDPLCTAHHFANVMFNVMRGGVFADQYNISLQDFLAFVSIRNRKILAEHPEFFSSLPTETNLFDLKFHAEASGVLDLIRLVSAYLPLSFSRRHGDPSRPWNRFVIDVKNKDGSLKLGYEGNWRDIFQNWEALAWSFPEFVESMICTFLNATTADGYNPYRITRDGIDWEIPEPHNPWANIGYWSDHQIIYLQKLMEISTRMHPGKLQELLSQPVFSHACVPYRIKPYSDLLHDPYSTIQFDWELEREIDARVRNLGTDGKLVLTSDGQVLHTTLAEKLLILLLTKLSNLVPEGGVWMNTQRPEWNDANNALVGKGLSVVTLGYLRRTIAFYKELLEHSGLTDFRLAREVHRFYEQIFKTLDQFQALLGDHFDDSQRRSMMDALGQAGSDYRWNYYSFGISGDLTHVVTGDVVRFLDLAQRYVEHSLRANQRDDHLYHSYNVLHLGNGTAAIGRLDEMLEGQVTILSSGMLSGNESLALLESLRNSRLYRPDQHSYILYPDRSLPGFLEKNCMTPEQVHGIALVAKLIGATNRSLIIQDEDGDYHFSGHIRNIKDVNRALQALGEQPEYAELVQMDADKIRALFEEVFHHNRFTGRSGTFFAYEGLGSIYWHMVSKLLLAVQETILRTRGEPSTQGLIDKYRDIRSGLSFNKSPKAYGAFPTDPYSHTPKDQGARQPGMSGMVKEEVLTRQMELGYFVTEGHLTFDFLMLDRKELLTSASVLTYWNTTGQPESLQIPAQSFVYFICQVPVILRASQETCVDVHFNDGRVERVEGHVLSLEESRHIFHRDGVIHHLVVSFL